MGSPRQPVRRSGGSGWWEGDCESEGCSTSLIFHSISLSSSYLQWLLSSVSLMWPQRRSPGASRGRASGPASLNMIKLEVWRAEAAPPSTRYSPGSARTTWWEPAERRGFVTAVTLFVTPLLAWAKFWAGACCLWSLPRLPSAWSCPSWSCPSWSCLAGPVLAGPVLADPIQAGPVLAGPVLAGPIQAGPVLAELPGIMKTQS